MNQKKKSIFFISREKEWELISKLIGIVNNSDFNFENTAVLMVSPDYSATVAMHLAHAWSDRGNSLSIIPIDVAFPDQDWKPFYDKMLFCKNEIKLYSKLICVEAGIIVS